MSSKTIYIIAGPTATGKTEVAIALAQRLGTAIVSADSRQCYRGMAIGTAQPAAAELEAVKHYFVNTFPVTEHITAAGYEALALGYLSQIFATCDTAVVCGGTGLYIKALCEGLDEMPPVDERVAGQAEDDYRHKGMAWLQQAVQQEDPAFYGTGEVQNPARLLRALGFIRTTGESITRYRTQVAKVRPFNIIKIGLELPREALYARINQRVDRMVQAGLLQEVEQLLPCRHLKNLQTVGYTELMAYIDGNCTLPQAVDKIKQHTRNYAKRQLTWFKKDKEIRWVDAGCKDIAGAILYGE